MNQRTGREIIIIIIIIIIIMWWSLEELSATLPY
jgi:hypothetical protein